MLRPALGVLAMSAAIGAAAVVAPGSASAADLYTPPPPTVEAPPPPAFTWSGCYIGGHGGGSWFSASASGGFSIDDGEGFHGGPLGGCNFQSGNFVFGIEGDVAFGEIDGDLDFGGVGVGDADLDLEPLGNVRGRIGWALDRVLIYGAGGLAIADADMRGSSETLLGFTGGGGIEFALNDNWSLRGEYLYTTFEEGTFGGIDAQVDDMHTIRGAVIWRFGNLFGY